MAEQSHCPPQKITGMFGVRPDGIIICCSVARVLCCSSSRNPRQLFFTSKGKHAYQFYYYKLLTHEQSEHKSPACKAEP